MDTLIRDVSWDLADRFLIRLLWVYHFFSCLLGKVLGPIGLVAADLERAVAAGNECLVDY